MKELPAFNRLTPEETNTLIRLAQAGDKAARNKVIEANMRLVAKIATRVSKRLGVPELLDEMIQAGCMGHDGRGGLVRAIEHFDPARDLRFSTYAAAWITFEAQAVPMRDSQVAGLTVVQRRARMRRVYDELSRELGRKATPAEVRESYVARGVRTPPTVEMIEAAIGAPLVQIDFAELTDPESDNGGGTSREYESGAYTPSALDLTLADLTLEAQLQQAHDFLAMLPDNERRVIELHFGIGCEKMTMPAIAAELGVKRARISHLRKRALERLHDAFIDAERAARRKLRADAVTHGYARVSPTPEGAKAA